MVGKEVASKFFRSLENLVEPLRFYDLKFEPLKEEGEFVCWFRGNSKFIATGRPYQNRYISRISVKDGLVYRMTEFYNPLVIINALGGEVVLPQS
jgi:ketosteroid isomerase-like protein